MVKHLESHLSGNQDFQLLMIVQGAGGTGKIVLIEEITTTFQNMGAQSLLTKTASSGVAASLIQGMTLHSWAGIPRTITARMKVTKKTQNKRLANISGKWYLIIDEHSMLMKDVLELLLGVLGNHCNNVDGVDATIPFGALNVILLGDFHQFPPAGNLKAVLYYAHSKTEWEQIGRHLYQQFNVVVNLTEQIRVTDHQWAELLSQLREGECMSEDLEEVDKLLDFGYLIIFRLLLI